MLDIKVTKRLGVQEPFTEDKVTKVVDWAAEGLKNVSASDVVMKASLDLYDGIPTTDIHGALVDAAVSLISAHAPDYQILAGRLKLFSMRKEAFGDYTPLPIRQQVERMVTAGRYDHTLLEDYTPEELDELDTIVDHDRDLRIGWSGMAQLHDKYVVQDRNTQQIFETPQYIYILVAATLFSKYPKAERIEYIRRFYQATSLGKVSLPTPIMAGVRTSLRQFSSCVVIETDDSIRGIGAAGTAIMIYVAQRAGIGLNFGAIRPKGSPIRDGSTVHTGVVQFLKVFEASVGSCAQGGIRKGSATAYYPFFHRDAREFLVLKNNRGTDETRVRHLDYAIQGNRLLLERARGHITLFNVAAIPEVVEAFYSGDYAKFKELYEAAENNPALRDTSVRVSTMDLLKEFMAERSQTGRYYWFDAHHVNAHGPFNPEFAPVRQSNLCVAPETMVLTDKGHLPIKSLAGSKVNIWNTEEWSEVEVKKTGENQKLIKVVTEYGQELECTEYHKFYIFDGYGRPYKEVRAHELKPGDKLMKFDAPVIEGKLTLGKAYQNGFYSGDGCKVKEGQRIYLYHDKMKLQHRFMDCHNGQIIVQPAQQRAILHYKDLRDKFFVPTANYTVESRLEWLAGYLDADGCVYRNGTNEALTATSANIEFLTKLQYMLQTLGVNAKIVHGTDAGMHMLPLNDGSGENGEFYCQEIKRLLINSCDTDKLMCLGLGRYMERLIVEARSPQRSAQRFNIIKEVVDEGRHDDTYCFEEPKLHLGVFNGIATGQCLEIALPTKPLKINVDDLDAEIALCTLSAFNWLELHTYEDFQECSDIVVRALDELLSYQDYPMAAAARSVNLYRPLGVGIINYAADMAKNGWKYGDQEALDHTHRKMEMMQYSLMKASAGLAKEKGRCEGFDNLRYAQGKMVIDTYCKNVDELCSVPLEMDWEGLRAEIAEHGIRNATLTALMPSETSSQVVGATNGIEPPRREVTAKLSKSGPLKQVVPLPAGVSLDDYTYAWEMKDNVGYLNTVAVLQKFVDQTISANEYWVPKNYEGESIPMKEMLANLARCIKYGIKTLYYSNTQPQGEDRLTIAEEQVDESCGGGGCKI